MAQKVWVSPRITRRYVDSYAHLDEWGQSFQVKELGMETIALSEDMAEGDTVRFGVVVPKHVNKKLALQALYDQYNRGGCAHEWDCCGCASYRATIRPVKKGFFSVLVKTSYNY